MAYNQYGGNQYGGPQRGYGPGGFGAGGGNYGPPPGADPQLWQWFTTVDTDRSGSIAPTELQQALVNGDWTPFDLDTVKLLMTLFDTDRSGTVGFNEFQGLWKYIKDWQGVFRHFDTDRSGSIDGQELNNALRQFGYNLSPELLRMVQRKYIPQGSTAGVGGPGGITFDRFVRCCVVIKQLTEAFQKLDPYHTGSVTMNYDTFMQTVLQAP
ncbi:hypothetical protein FRC05_009095 [Tulasnella sp. 425]|nr:hypothetical protein FRC05_009095 [Tulasnella sp. 425]